MWRVIQITLDDSQMMRYVVNISNKWRTVSPEYVGSLILKQLRETGEQNLSVPLHRVVMAVPAEFDERQRNYTKSAAQLAGAALYKLLVLLLLLLLSLTSLSLIHI